MNEIIIKSITKKYKNLTVINNLSMEIALGKTTCIMGPSGCGKTTLLRLIAGLETPDTGDITNVPKKISFVFAEDRLCEDFTPMGNVKFITGNSVSDDFIIRKLAELGLGDVIDKPVKKLSSGMQRRVAIARALCVDFDLLILDEPFKGLDRDLKIKIIDYIKKETAGKTVIVVTHHIEEAEYFGEIHIDLSKEYAKT